MDSYSVLVTAGRSSIYAVFTKASRLRAGVAALLAAAACAACAPRHLSIPFEEGSGPDRAEPQKKASPVPDHPAQCVELAGRYRIDGLEYEILQQGCTTISWVRGDEHVEYVADGVDREMTGPRGARSLVRAYYEGDHLWIEIRETGERRGAVQARERWFRSLEPCGLRNPDRILYLARETYPDQKDAPAHCEAMAPL